MISPARAHPDQVFALALQHHQAGRLSEAEALYHQVLALEPRYADALQLLGAILHQRGNSDLAVERIRQAIAIAPDNPVAHFNLGEIHRAIGRNEEAIAEFHRAIQLKPDYLKAHHNLGVALADEGLLNEAMAAYDRALEIDPAHALVHYCRAHALQKWGRLDETIESYRRALQLRADWPEAWNNLGAVLTKRGHFDEAVAACGQAVQHRPEYAAAYNNLGNVLKDDGQLERACAAYRKALELDSPQAVVHSNLIYALHLHREQDDGTIAAECALWNRRFHEPLRKLLQRHGNHRDPERRLRIGYLSSDLCLHPVSYFLAPLLKAHDHDGFEIYCYSGSQQSDTVTDVLRRSTDVWREVHHLSDAQIAELIRADSIDILVDLAMHTDGNLLLVMAREPAPVQVSWLAYPGTTGMEAIHYRLTDATIDPLTKEDGERPPGGRAVRLPDCWCCYEPLHAWPEPGPLPAFQNKVVTFGSLNQYGKITGNLLHCWARLLQAADGSRLLMVCPPGSARARVLAIFASQGIASERVEFAARGDWDAYAQLFQRIDVALDTFPCNGMTTTCHTLWMGVPVVTRAGSTTVSRAASSLLQMVGLPEWVAHDEEGYVRIAIDAAHDLHRLADLRAGLRPRMQASPLMDAPRFARNVETAFRTMWREWCRDF